MRVRFERSGGFAGITLGGEFDSANLPPEQTSELNRLIEGSRFFELPAVIRTTQAGADRFQFTVSVDTGTQKHSIELDEKSAPENLRPLLKWLTDAQRNLIATNKQREHNVQEP